MTAPFADTLQTFGNVKKAKINNESDALGGVALEIETNNGKNPWDMGIYNTVGVPVNKGDTIYMVFFAKALSLPNGKSSALIKSVGVQKGTAPYTPIVAKDFNLNEEWQTFGLAGIAESSFGVSETQVSMQIATGKQKLAFGPVFVFNLGPDVELSQLPLVSE